MSWREHIEINPGVLLGKPVVKGTRIAVELVLDMIAAGVPDGEILDNYPRLSSEDIRACIAYAADVIRSERVMPLSA